MAMTMLDKPALRKDTTDWPAALRDEFEREANSPNPCVGNALVSEVEVENGLKAEQRYEVITDGMQLRVTTTIQGAGGNNGKRTITHTYERPGAGASIKQDGPYTYL